MQWTAKDRTAWAEDDKGQRATQLRSGPTLRLNRASSRAAGFAVPHGLDNEPSLTAALNSPLRLRLAEARVLTQSVRPMLCLRTQKVQGTAQTHASLMRI